MAHQAWDVELIVPSRYDNEPRIKVTLPHAVVEGELVRIGVENDFYRFDTVFFDKDCDRDYVKRSLVEHDGYPSNIRVQRAR